MSYRINEKFIEKWRDITANKHLDDDFILFLPKGESPKTQRQINLFWYYKFIEDVIKGRNYKNGLELGCGRGTTSLYLNLYKNIDVSLVDISKEAIDVAQDIFELMNGRGDFIVADCGNLPFPDENFDIVYSIGLLEHLSNPDKTIEETYRVLRSGGVMISLNIPAKSSVQNINKLYKKSLSLLIGKKYSHKDYYRNDKKPEDYAQGAKKAGFKNVFTINVNPFPLFVPMPRSVDRQIAKLYNLIILIRSFFMKYPFKTNYQLSQGHFLVGYK